MAYDNNLAGVVLSNHGGRQLDFSRSGLEVLVEASAYLKKHRNVTLSQAGVPSPDGKGRFEVFVDGGVRRATDVLKAVALGATAVGLGRPFVYAFSAYGPEGVDHALNILRVSARLLFLKSDEKMTDYGVCKGRI
jgi:L-lactate dehydrogenase (cytochrome)